MQRSALTQAASRLVLRTSTSVGIRITFRNARTIPVGVLMFSWRQRLFQYSPGRRRELHPLHSAAYPAASAHLPHPAHPAAASVRQTPGLVAGALLRAAPSI